MKRFIAGFFVAVCVLTGVATLSQSTAKPRDVGNPAIVEKLRTMIRLRESMVAANNRASQSGKGESDGRYESALAEARLQLAQELGDSGLEIAALNDLLETQKHQLQSSETRMSLGVVSGTEVDEHRAQILETEIRILRVQQRARPAESLK